MLVDVAWPSGYGIASLGPSSLVWARYVEAGWARHGKVWLGGSWRVPA